MRASFKTGGLRKPATPDLYTSGQRNMTFKQSSGEEVPGYLVSKLTHAYSGVIMLQEWWGLNTSIQKAADQLSRSNFRILVPDLYRGKVAKDNEEAGNLMNNLDFHRAIEDIRGATKYLLDSGVKRVGIIGFSMGGALVTAAAACDNPVKELSCGIVLYGVPDLTQLKPENIKFPIQSHFGMRDNLKGFSDPETAEKFEKWLKTSGVEGNTFFRYERAGHAFTNIDRPEVYNEFASKLAWMRLCAFFNKHLNMPTFEAMQIERSAAEAKAKAAALAASTTATATTSTHSVSPTPTKEAANIQTQIPTTTTTTTTQSV